MGSYSLLADDNSRFSNRYDHYHFFRSHLIYNILVGGGVTFSDNQILCSSNLRLLARRDAVIRELFKAGNFSLAMRRRGDHLYNIEEIHRDFSREGKIRFGEVRFAESPELLFMEKHAEIIRWEFEDVTANYAKLCRKLITDQFGARIGDNALARLVERMAEEENEQRTWGGGLGREFLQNRLPDFMVREGMMESDADHGLLRRCTDAPYLSNLPQLIGLDPIYSDEHRASFELMRGHSYRMVDLEEPTDLRSPLDHEHFVAGLNQLYIDDIHHIHETVAYKSYRRLVRTDDVPGSIDDIHTAFYELNREIEDRIISRFPSIRRHSPQSEGRRIRKTYATIVEKGASVALDLLGIGLNAIGSNFMIPGLVADFVIDAVKGRITGPERPHLAAATHDMQMRKLKEYLRARGRDMQINVGEAIAQSASFDREVIVS